VEEGPAKPKKRATTVKSSLTNADRLATAPKPVDETVEDEEEDEVSDEDDKFDINDSSPEAASASPSVSKGSIANAQTSSERDLGRSKTRATPKEAAAALSEGNPFMRGQKSRTRSRSGVDTPGRYAGSQPHPPRISRQAARSDSPTSSISSFDSAEQDNIEQHGARDDIHSPRATLSSGRSRIPKDRDVEAESMNMKTPTVPDHTRRNHHHKTSLFDCHLPHRAFAVWGQDESGSSASDSDA
jgi:NAD+ kinase